MRKYLYLTVFFSGMTTLALEFGASRLLGYVFGTSNLVWASVIGLIMVFLALGYFIGGRLADRRPHFHVLFAVLAWGAFIGGLVPLIARPVLTAAANAFDQLNVGLLFGSFTSVLILFSLPVTLLGIISPFAIRLAVTDPAQSGSVSGRIYAISTIGSFIGSFLPTVVFYAWIGVTWTFILFSVALLLVAIIGQGLASGWRRALAYAWMPLVLIVAGVFVERSPLKTSAGQIYETESAYNYIQVLEKDGYRILRLNEGQGEHSVWRSDVLDYQGPWEQFLAAPFFNPAPHTPADVHSLAIVGLAAGTAARQASAVFGPIPIDGFEIDPKIIDVGREYFDMNEPNLNAIAADGRWGLARSTRRYSVIAVDAYRPPYIPWHLTTQEFFQLVYERLEDDGVMVINVGRSPTDRRLIDGLTGTIRTVFPTVHVMDVPGSFNSILYATRQPTRIEDLYANLLALYAQPGVHPLLLRSLERVVIHLQPTPESAIVYTDDWAPIEWITNDMVLSYVLFGDMEALQEEEGTQP